MTNIQRYHQRHHRQQRVRAKISGTSSVPRLSVFKSLRFLYVQVIDDTIGSTLVAFSTKDKEYDTAEKLGAAVGKACVEKGITQIVFDRGGYPYMGSIKVMADAARAAGLTF